MTQKEIFKKNIKKAAKEKYKFLSEKADKEILAGRVLDIFTSKELISKVAEEINNKIQYIDQGIIARNEIIADLKGCLKTGNIFGWEKLTYKECVVRDKKEIKDAQNFIKLHTQGKNNLKKILTKLEQLNKDLETIKEY